MSVSSIFFPAAGFIVRSCALGLGACVLLAAAGCGSPLVEPARSGPSGGVLAPQGVPAQPAGTANYPPGGFSPGAWNNVEHVPASQVLTRPDPDQKAVYHEVRSGETLDVVAATYGVPVKRLIRANGFDGASKLKAGQLIYIPQKDAM